MRHAGWCNVEWNAGPCDCGNGGRCLVCGNEGPCGFADDGTPLIHAPIGRAGDISSPSPKNANEATQ